MIKNISIVKPLMFAFFLVISPSFSALGVSLKTSVYEGYLASSDATLKYPVRLDLIAEKDFGMRFFFKVMFGQHDSSEYITSSYSIPPEQMNEFSHYTLSPGVNGIGAVVTIVGEFSPDGLEFKGTVKSRTGGVAEGVLSLTRVDHLQSDERQSRVNSIFGATPIVSPISGEYLGSCDGRYMLLQLQAIHSKDQQADLGSPTAGLQIIASTSFKAPRRTSNVMVSDWIPSIINSSARVFPLLRRIQVPGVGVNGCWINPEGIHCGSTCELKKADTPLSSRLTTTNPVGIGPIMDLPAAIDISQPPSNLIDLISGDFSGEIRFEAANAVYRMHLSAELDGDPSEALEGLPHPNIGISSNICFSSTDDLLCSIQSYKSIPIPQGDLKDLYFAGIGDIELLISSWSPRRIDGVAYSKSFGRIGVFTLFQNNIDAIAPASARSVGVEGEISNQAIKTFEKDWHFSVDKGSYRISLPSSPASTGVEVFPFRFQGSGRGVFANMVDSASALVTIYDPFTNRMTMTVNVFNKTIHVFGMPDGKRVQKWVGAAGVSSRFE